MSKGNGIIVSVDGKCLTITVPIATLVTAFENDPKNEVWDGDAGFDIPKVTNAQGFLADVVIELERETDDGMPLLHVAFDDAMKNAWENGSEHVAEKPTHAIETRSKR